MEYVESEHKIVIEHTWESKIQFKILFFACFGCFFVQSIEFITELKQTGKLAADLIVLGTTMGLFAFLSIVFGYLILSRWYNQDRIEITPNGVMRHAKVLLGGENTYKFEKTEEDIVRDVRISTVGSNHSIIVSKNGHRKSMIASLKSHSFAMTVTEAIRIIWQSQKEE